MFNVELNDIGRGVLFDRVHPAYKAMQDRWPMLLDAVDGEGGFVDGSYLWKFPRELESEWLHRKAQARYHNYAEAIVGDYVRKVMSGVTRTSANPDLAAWWSNVDGAGTSMHDFLVLQLTRALTAGHVGVLVDKTRDLPTGPARTDERARVILTPYLPMAIRDWRLHQDASIRAVKLFEDVPHEDLLGPAPKDEARDRVLLWDEEEWVRVPRDPDLPVEREMHALGVTPFVVVRPIPHTRWPVVGRSVLGDGSLLRALYNRQSEEDDVLRNQAFSIFVVNVPTDVTDLEQVKKDMGSEVGTTRALFVRGTGTYETPDMGVPAQIRENQQHLIRELYRMAHIQFDKGSRDAESAEAKRQDAEELSGILRGVAAEMRRVELALARLWCHWTAPTAQQAEQRFEAAQVQVQYPDEFVEDLPLDDLALDAESLKLEIGPTWDAVVKKDAVGRLKPHLDPETRAKINAEIEGRAGVRPAGALDPQALRDGAAARLAALADEESAA